MRTLPVITNSVKFNNFKSQENEIKVTELPISAEAKQVVQKKNDSKKLPIVTAALAVASLGVSAYALSKGRKLQSGSAQIEGLTAKIDELTSKLANKQETLGEDFISKINGLVDDVNKMKNSSVREDLLEKISGIYKMLEDTNIKFTNNKGFFSELVEINNRPFQLATVYNKVGGDVQAGLETKLRTESTRRLLGLGKPLEKLPDGGMIRIPTSEYKGVASTGGLSIVPKEIAENLSKIIAGRQNIQVAVDMPLYRGIVEKSEIKGEYTRLFNDLRRTADGKFEFIQTVVKDGRKPEVKVLQKLEKINTMNLKIHTENGIENHVVDVLMGETKIPLNAEKVLADALPEVTSKAQALENGKSFEFGTLLIEKSKEGELKASAKVKTIFYDNGKGGKFDLNVPLDRASNIYNNAAISAGETERFIHFNKYFYEQMLRNDESKVPLSADMILGNDWQTGAIVAMTRLLTPVKEAYGLNPMLAEKIYNTPIAVILHNARESGGIWNSQEKILNVMFGEHAATIAKNAHMPNLSLAGKTGGLNAELFNGLMQGEGVNPQMMAVVYADYVIPVSEGYAKGIATQEIFGMARTKIFEFRAREGDYGILDNLKLIANQNGINPELITAINKNLIGIPNGCDRANNTLTAKIAEQLAKDLELPASSFAPLTEGQDLLLWHNKNKMAGINKMQADIELARKTMNDANPVNLMQIEMVEMTDLAGVTEKTPVFVSAGRIVDQKGLDIFGDSIVEFYKSYKGSEYPVFYVQGIGDDVFKNAILNAKREVAKTNPEAAKRIVFANLFSEKGRYDCAKLVADWSVMPSWFEPCGLSHKEIAQFSGSGAVVNRTGGLAEDLEEGISLIVSDFNPYRSEIAANAKSFAKAIEKAVEIHSDDAKYKEVLDYMMTVNLDWAREGGPIYKYIKIAQAMGVLAKDLIKAV